MRFTNAHNGSRIVISNTTGRTAGGPAVYVEPGVLPVAVCIRLVRAMDAGETEEAEILERDFSRDELVRRAFSVEVGDAALRELETAIDGWRDRLAGFFGIPLGRREGAGFLRYPEGGFYAPHVDRADVESWPDAARRAIAVVLFLNGSREADPSGAFSGGILRVHAEDRTIDIIPRTGCLVAFRADALHEVTVVHGGTRDAVVDWFYEAS